MSEDASSDSLDTEDTASETKEKVPLLTFEESRVLGCLFEKEATVPDQYPLSFNALQQACNQSSNRDPVVSFDMTMVEEAMEGLRYKKLSILVRQAGGRVPKCKHTIEEKYPYLSKGQRALLCVLLLRGPQTVGELRQRSERMHSFADLDRVQTVLEELIAYTPEPLVQMIPAGAGRRVVTYMHTLCGDSVPTLTASFASEGPSAEKSEAAVASWRSEMEQEIAALREEVATLREQIALIQSELGL